MSPMRMIDSKHNSTQRSGSSSASSSIAGSSTIHPDTESNKDYADECEQIADDDATDKDMIHDDSDSNILKRIPDAQSQVMYT